MNSKSQLAIALSKLEVFEKPSFKLEQFPTDSEVAASILWNLSMNGDIEGKVIADLGCGTGVLGIGALLLGASKVYFVDVDTAALAVLGNNLKSLGINNEDGVFEIVNKDVTEFDIDGVDVVIQNPPFGTRQEHADKQFLEKAFELARVVVSFHKTSTQKFVEAISKDHGFSIIHRWKVNFPLKKTFDHHKSKIKKIEVTCYRMEKS